MSFENGLDNSELLDIEVNHFLDNIEKISDHYIDRNKLKRLVMDDIIKSSESYKNRCLMCGDDMGKDNPRQLCGKTYCYNT